MTPSKLRATIILERLRWIRQMNSDIQTLPIATKDDFIENPHTGAAAESYLRRGLEALFDLGRHLLAKGFGRAPAEYKSIAQELHAVGVLSQTEASLMMQMAGFRNRLVHFYDEVKVEELFEICHDHLREIEQLARAIEQWIQEHPERIDHTL